MKSLLFTGASGFLGRNTLPIIKDNYNVDTLGFCDSDTYNYDLSKGVPELKKKYDIVLHAAGKAHVIPKIEKEKMKFYEVNYNGTKNLCSALELSGIPSSFIFISTVAVYGCNSGILITEDHPLNGVNSYAESKIMAERYLTEWCSKNNVNLTILRPSLLAGKNPPGNLGTMIHGLQDGKYVRIGGGDIRKSVAMASDIAEIIPLVEETGGIFNLCDNNHPSFAELEELICKQLNKKLPISIPYWVIKPFALVGDLLGSKSPFNSIMLNKIIQPLTFSNEKIKIELGFIPSNVLENFKI